MLHILIEIWIWVAVAAVVGAAFGWWMRSIRAAREVAREALLWQQRIQRLRKVAVGLTKTANAARRQDDSADAGA